MVWNVRYAPPHLTPTRQLVHSPLRVHSVEPARKKHRLQDWGLLTKRIEYQDGFYARLGTWQQEAELAR